MKHFAVAVLLLTCSACGQDWTAAKCWKTFEDRHNQLAVHFGSMTHSRTDQFKSSIGKISTRDLIGWHWPTTENVALVLSQDAAEQLVAARNLSEQQTALGTCVYLNAEPITLRLADQAPCERPDLWGNRVCLGFCS